MPNEINSLENNIERLTNILIDYVPRRRVPIDMNAYIDTPTLVQEIETAEEVGKQIIDPEAVISLYKTYNGARTAKYKDCIKTKRNQYFHKDDPNIVKNYLDGSYLYLGDAFGIIVGFLSNGLPDLNKGGIIDRSDTNKVIRCYYLNNENKELYDFYTPYNLIDLTVYTECLYDGCFYHENAVHKMSKKYARYRKVNAIKKASLLPINEQYKYGVKSPSFLLTEGKKYSFGIEFETICGQLPAHLDDELNYEAVHDGSLRDAEGNVNGGEYVTGILVGDTGFYQLKKLAFELTRRTKVDKKCGMHTHLGLENGKSFNKELIVTLYKLALMLEKDIFAMVPKSRRNNEYCRPLEQFVLNYNEKHFSSSYDFNLKIDQDYDSIMAFLSSGSYSTDKVNKKYDHPLGHKCGYNHKSARYCWLNFIPAVFNTRRNGVYTIEFRNHPGTTSYIKTKNWLLICMGILWYAENYQKEILMSNNISLKGIMMLAYPKKCDKIISYIEKRTLKFANKDEEAALQAELLDYEEETVDSNVSINKMSIKDL